MGHFLLVFDLDGTLVDSASDLRSALNQMLRERGRRSLSLPQVKRMIGDGAAALVARALMASGGDPADEAGALARFIELYEADAVRLSRPYPAVPETLAALRRRGRRRRPFPGQKARSRSSVGIDRRDRGPGRGDGDDRRRRE